MNLVRVQIENFKQYVERIDIDIPSQVTIGVIGTNGVGKTTLFQAIEWCLYNPITISGKDVRPRGRSGNPKVSVTLESRDGAKRWIVERELKQSSAIASVYEVQEDGTESPVVQGTRQVTDYVATRLIELSHKAFVATFFTRQKELHFFGDIRETDRRREVGKLLGLETIRRAQMSIGEDRTAAGREAGLLHKQYANEIADRDLDTEIALANQQVSEAKSAHELASAAMAQATSRTLLARDRLETVQAARDHFNEVRVQLDQAQQDQTNASNQHASRIDDITRLEQSRITREHLLPIAAQYEALRAQVQSAEAERERFRAKLDLERNLQLISTSRIETIRTIEQEVVVVRAHESVTQWRWDPHDHGDVRAAVARLMQTAREWSADAFEQRLNAFNAAQRAAHDAEQATARLREWHELRDSLLEQRKTLIAGSDPDEQLKEIASKRGTCDAALAAWNAERTRLTTDLSRRQRLLNNIQNSNFDEGCPTCGREFSDNDADLVLESIQRHLDEIHAEVTKGDADAAKVIQQLEKIKTEQASQERRLKELRKLEERISKSVGVISDQEETVATTQREAERSLQLADLAAPPQPGDIDRVSADLQLSRKLHQAVGRITIHVDSIERLDKQRQENEMLLVAVRDTSFNEPSYLTLVKQRDEAATAKTRIEEFDRELLQLPKAIADRDALASRIAELEQALTKLKQDLLEIGYDPGLLLAAVESVKQAEKEEREAAEQSRQHELTLQKSEFARKQVIDEHDRIRKLATRADTRQREADELSLMYNLFGEFEQFVVSRLTPALSAMTSDLVRQVTDGKYDDVSFDDNFGIQVADGDENPFPLATFSGGERDAIALCARLALSQMIGQQAADQPGFLVLDEVFGSLDRDRRTRLLELFGNLSSISDRFQQVFIISHVDDVRTAPILDELWLVQENDEGMSSITNLSPGADIGEL